MGNPTVGVRGGPNPGNGETMIGVVCTGLAKVQQPVRKEEGGSWQGLVGLTDTQYASLATSRLWPEPTMGRDGQEASSGHQGMAGKA